jgi:patatin-like phospholipase/acyl hydrolase
MQQEYNLPRIPRPCDVFDLAGGTSTGGIIVIMLFRLEMPIDDAIDAYATLARQVFSERKWFFQEGTFKASRLEDAILHIIQSRLSIEEADAREVRMLNKEGTKW